MQIQVEEEWIRSVFPKYNLSIYEIVPLLPSTDEAKSVLVLTDKGKKELHWSQDLAGIDRLYHVLEGIAQHGYRRLPRMIRTLYGEPYVTVSDKRYWLTDHWEGRPLEWNIDDLVASVRNLAQFHRALDKWSPIIDVEDRSQEWSRTYRQCVLQWSESTREWSQEDQLDAFQRTWLEVAPVIIGYANEALEWIPAGSRIVSHISLGGYRLEDACMTRDGQLVLKRAEFLTKDAAVYDLAAFCHRMRSQGFTAELPRILHTYQEVRELSDWERQWVKAYLKFPHAVHWVYQNYRKMGRSPTHFSQRILDVFRRHQQWNESFQGV